MSDFSPAMWVVVGIAVTVQIGLMLAALITVIRTPAERLTAPRIVWILLCFIQFIGPIVFFVAGRKPVQAVDPLPSGERTSITEQVISELYPQEPSAQHEYPQQGNRR